MTPHTLVLKPGLVIYSIYKGYWFWGVHRSTSSAAWRSTSIAVAGGHRSSPRFIEHF